MSIGDRVELGVLTVSGFLLGILTAAFLLVRIGSFPFPITALIAGVVNVLILKIAETYTKSAWQYAPLIAWTFVTAMAMLPVFGNGSLIGDWRLLLLLACGLALPAFYASTARIRNLTQS
ncbi:hypothetical protein [Gordonia neofelifaecis]|uniref:Uncharacterized protein n=1 Tax=Gordonia neofelifaecis NRRL B-59395 TaxID=644548 RepID=F1YEN8_9ACTN|nr:hypothetical protein [Gordonia neofelifaecis]EGD56871.1 hypothetical protein SCNU_00795 [Gordonia neofelifaecis NRRL B-59395]